MQVKVLKLNSNEKDIKEPFIYSALEDYLSKSKFIKNITVQNLDSVYNNNTAIINTIKKKFKQLENHKNTMKSSIDEIIKYNKNEIANLKKLLQ